MVIAQAVEQQYNQFAGGGGTDVGAAPGADTVADLTVAGVRTDALHGLDRGPAHVLERGWTRFWCHLRHSGVAGAHGVTSASMS